MKTNFNDLTLFAASFWRQYHRKKLYVNTLSPPQNFIAAKFISASDIYTVCTLKQNTKTKPVNTSSGSGVHGRVVPLHFLLVCSRFFCCAKCKT